MHNINASTKQNMCVPYYFTLSIEDQGVDHDSSLRCFVSIKIETITPSQFSASLFLNTQRIGSVTLTSFGSPSSSNRVRLSSLHHQVVRTALGYQDKTCGIDSTTPYNVNYTGIANPPLQRHHGNVKEAGWLII